MKKYQIAILILCISRHFVVDSVDFAKSNKQACNFRTRLTFRRPEKDNVLSILAGHEKRIESVPLKITFNHDSVGITKPTYVIEGSCSSSFPSCIEYCKFDSSRYSVSHFPKEKTNSICVNFNESDTAIYTCSTTQGGWRVLKFYKTVGHGAKCYKRVRNAIFDWDFEADNGKKLVGIMSASKQQYHETHKTLLATFAEIRFPKPIKSIFVVNPVHVTHEIIDSKQIPKCIYSSTSYATLSGHLLSGEERVSVIWRKYSGGEVVVEIVSFSRPAPSVSGKLVWPVIGRMQRNFFLEEMKHLDRIGKS